MKRILVLWVIVVLIVGCALKKSEYLPITFEVNKELLGEEIHPEEMGLVYCAPQNWNESDAVTRQLQDVHFTKSHCTVMLLSFVSEDSLAAALAVSSIKPDSTDFSLGVYVRNVYNQYEPGLCNASQFSHNGIEFDQLITSEGGTVHICLIAHPAKEEYYQFDYVIKQKEYYQLSKAIESSIGSINQKKGEK